MSAQKFSSKFMINLLENFCADVYSKASKLRREIYWHSSKLCLAMYWWGSKLPVEIYWGAVNHPQKFTMW